MIVKLELVRIIEDQQRGFPKDSWIEREMAVPLDSKRVIIISGVRRCGKSTLIKQKVYEKKNSVYVNFEDPRLVNFTIDDFVKLEEVMAEMGKSHLILDEVQNVEKWELYARMANEKGIPLFITGSNAGMLSRELGTHLTGRYKQIELFPFSYNEFLGFFKKDKNLASFDSYFELGGFPEYLEEQDEDYLRTLLRDIITRDIAIRRNILNENQLVRLAVHLFSNIGKEFSYNKLSKILEFKSVRTVIDYCDYLSESYLVDFISMFSYSVKKQLVNPKKVYCVDPSFAKANSLSFSKDSGRRLENIIYNALRNRFKEIFYFRTPKSECDFLVKQNEKIVNAIQVCMEVTNENINREILGLKNAMEETNAEKGTIITYNQEDTLEGFELIPAWKWLS